MSGQFGQGATLRSHTTMIAMAAQAPTRRVNLQANEQGYGFAISTQPWQVHGLNHFVDKVKKGGAAHK
eukprot:gene24919-29996_t